MCQESVIGCGKVFLLFFFTLNHPSPLSFLSSSKPGAKLENRIMKSIKILVRNWVCHQNFPGANKPFPYHKLKSKLCGMKPGSMGV